ncbi:Protein-glutamine gamma-glutamyltransferase [Novipirellula galeiformis]|uniref:Protein-glutamine gamma-glutamyltransferase n=1 Tax=Novipirellula galeiformis TaxID=2528004 RepID=A0A5C6C4I0_9BACT|nr:transglutaminase-like domain-containing protein [Novipirellula galeiformis]TWU17709.1 Protein-glutamine gamma-glutamyltransferase [Novipirellula galeiformis]
MLLRHQWFLVVLYLALGAFVGNTFQTWAVLFCITLAAAAALLAQRYLQSHSHNPADSLARVEATPRMGVRVAGGACLLAILVMRAGPLVISSQSDPFTGVADGVVHAALAWIAFLWVIRRAEGHPLMLVLGMMIVLLCVSTGDTLSSSASQMIVGLCLCSGYALASQCILGCGPLSDSRFRTRSSSLSEAAGANQNAAVAPETSYRACNRSVVILSAFALVAMIIVTGVIGTVARSVLPQMQAAVQSTLKNSVEASYSMFAEVGTRYVSGSTLGSLCSDKGQNADEIGLRIYAHDTPGYLRGTVFDFYKQSRWCIESTYDGNSIEGMNPNLIRSVFAAGRGLSNLKHGRGNKLDHFEFVSESKDPVQTMEVHNVPFKGTTIFLPLGTRWIEAQSTCVYVSHHQSVSYGVDVTQPYVVAVAAEPAKEELNRYRHELLTQVPEEVRSVAKPLAEHICVDDLDVREKANKIVDFFRLHFDYSLDLTRAREGVDPIVYFLQTRHPAHCEYFASATVVLLRSLGIPARYVTGYVVDEHLRNGGYWVARNRDAHAWAEVYDAESQTWFAVESTPGHRYSALANRPMEDRQCDLAGAPLAARSTFIAAVGSSLAAFMVSIQSSDSVLALLRLLHAPMFLLLSIVVWRRYRQGTRRSSDPLELRSRKMLKRIDRRLQRRALVRSGNETMHQFADRIDAYNDFERKGDSEGMRLLADWYREFAQARYQGELPTEIRKI